MTKNKAKNRYDLIYRASINRKSAPNIILEQTLRMYKLELYFFVLLIVADCLPYSECGARVHAVELVECLQGNTMFVGYF